MILISNQLPIVYVTSFRELYETSRKFRVLSILFIYLYTFIIENNIINHNIYIYMLLYMDSFIHFLCPISLAIVRTVARTDSSRHHMFIETRIERWLTTRADNHLQ